MIFYFSATGNSCHVANRLAAATEDKAVSILDLQGQPVTIGPGERFVLVYPNYCGGVPSVVADFLKKGKFCLDQGAELILVITYGNNTGASAAIATKYFRRNTKRVFDAMYSVKMPDTWTPVFDLTDQAMLMEINRKADEEVDGIISRIQGGARGDFVRDKLGKMMEFIYPVFYKKLSQTSNLHAEETCIGCGECARMCPVGAIEMKEGKPHWVKKNCAMCLGCLHRCPAFAIQYGDQTKNHGQYLHPDEQ